MPKVKVHVRISIKKGKEYRTYFITVPKVFIESLGIKEGEELECIMQPVEVGGKIRNAIVLYKP